VFHYQLELQQELLQLHYPVMLDIIYQLEYVNNAQEVELMDVAQVLIMLLLDVLLETIYHLDHVVLVEVMH